MDSLSFFLLGVAAAFVLIVLIASIEILDVLSTLIFAWRGKSKPLLRYDVLHKQNLEIREENKQELALVREEIKSVKQEIESLTQEIKIMRDVLMSLQRRLNEIKSPPPSDILKKYARRALEK